MLSADELNLLKEQNAVLRRKVREAAQALKEVLATLDQSDRTLSYAKFNNDSASHADGKDRA